MVDCLCNLLTKTTSWAHMYSPLHKILLCKYSLYHHQPSKNCHFIWYFDLPYELPRQKVNLGSHLVHLSICRTNSEQSFGLAFLFKSVFSFLETQELIKCTVKFS